MIPKLESAVRAIEAGVARVHLVDGRVDHAIVLELFTPEGIGTMVTPDHRRPVSRPSDRHEGEAPAGDPRARRQRAPGLAGRDRRAAGVPGDRRDAIDDQPRPGGARARAGARRRRLRYVAPGERGSYGPMALLEHLLREFALSFVRTDVRAAGTDVPGGGGGGRRGHRPRGARPRSPARSPATTRSSCSASRAWRCRGSSGRSPRSWRRHDEQGGARVQRRARHVGRGAVARRTRATRSTRSRSTSASRRTSPSIVARGEQAGAASVRVVNGGRPVRRRRSSRERSGPTPCTRASTRW